MCVNRKIVLDKILLANAGKVLIQNILNSNVNNILDRVCKLIIPRNNIGNAGAKLIADLLVNRSNNFIVLDIS